MGRPKSSKVWRSYEAAAEWAQAQKLTGAEQWRSKVKEPGFLPEDIPACPNTCYGETFRAKGGYGAFLGTGRVATRCREYRSLVEASDWAQAQGVRGFDDWMRQVKRPGFLPKDIPACPNKVYGKAFKKLGGYGGFLGTGRVSNAAKGAQFWSLEKVTRWARKQGVSGQSDWFRRCKDPSFRPKGVPSAPVSAYGKEAFAAIGGWGGFLGTGNISSAQVRKTAVSLNEAAAWARKQGVISCTDWFEKIKADRTWLSQGIPRNPAASYGDAFRRMGGWPGFLGQARRAGQSKVEQVIRHAFCEVFDCQTEGRSKVVVPGHRPFLVDMVCPSLRLVVEYDGRRFHAEPASIARDRLKTDRLCQAGWLVVRLREYPLPLLREEWDVHVSHEGDYQARIRVMFEHLAFLAEQGEIKGGKTQAKVIRRKMKNLRSASYTSLLSAGWRPMEEAAKWAQSMKVTSSTDWRRRKRESGFLPWDIPANPDRDYGREFQERGGWGWFLGTGVQATSSRKYRSLQAARRWAVAQGFKNALDWFHAAREDRVPKDIPRHPPGVYAQPFKSKGGWGWFLGTGNRSTRPHG